MWAGGGGAKRGSAVVLERLDGPERWTRTPSKVWVEARWEESVVENKVGKVGGKVRMEIAVEVVVERLDVEAVDDERLVVEIGDGVGEVLLLLGWRESVVVGGWGGGGDW